LCEAGFKPAYDHWVRGGEEWTRIKAYIENNLAKAGLVERPEVEPVGKPVEV